MKWTQTKTNNTDGVGDIYPYFLLLFRCINILLSAIHKRTNYSIYSTMVKYIILLFIIIITGCGIYDYAFLYPPVYPSPDMRDGLIGFMHKKENYAYLRGYDIIYRYFYIEETAANEHYFQSQADNISTTDLNNILNHAFNFQEPNIYYRRAFPFKNEEIVISSEPLIRKNILSSTRNNFFNILPDEVEKTFFLFDSTTEDLIDEIARNVAIFDTDLEYPVDEAKLFFDINPQHDDIPDEYEYDGNSDSKSLYLAFFAIGIGGGNILPPPSPTRVIYIGKFKWSHQFYE